MKIILLLLAISLSTFVFCQNTSVSHSVFFDKNSDKISISEQQKLDAFYSNVTDSNIISVDILGYCDTDGSVTYNRALAQRRIDNAYANQLNKNQSVIKTLTPIGEIGSKGDTEISKSENRKVEITIQYVPTARNAFQDPISVYKLLAPRCQQFCINPTRDTVLILEQGSIVAIPAFTFEQDCTLINSNDCITIEADEVLSKSDSYLHTLTTQSNGNIIESAGMLRLKANYKGRPAYVTPTKELMVMLPTEKLTVGDYEMFTGTIDPHSDQMNWVQNNSSELSNISMRDLTICGTGSPWTNAATCKLFFCKIRRFFTPKKKRVNLNFSRYTPESDSIQNLACDQLDSLYLKYDVDNYQDLQLAINAALLQKYNVKTLPALRAAMKAERIANLENQFSQGTADYDDLRYMVYNTSNLGWANCDAFSEIKKYQKTKVIVETDFNPDIDVKLVFKNRNIILSPNGGLAGRLYFDGIPKSELATVVAIRMQNNQPEIFMKEITVGKKPIKIDFKKVTIEELKAAVKMLDS